MDPRASPAWLAWPLFLLTTSLSTNLPAQDPSAIPAVVAHWSDRDAPPTGRLLFNASGSQFIVRILAGQRTAPGIVEVHEADSDLLCILDGAATFVTGGTVADRRVLSATEAAGTAIEGGESRELARGDVILVPHGTPHWFRRVDGEIRYLALKLREHPSTAAPAATGYWPGQTIFPARATLIEHAGYAVGQVQVVVRATAGRVESHDVDDDLLFIVEGAASVIIGGTIAGERSSGPNQKSGDAIAEGVQRRVGKGDVLVIPRATPHQFVTIEQPVRYVALKLR